MANSTGPSSGCHPFLRHGPVLFASLVGLGLAFPAQARPAPFPAAAHIARTAKAPEHFPERAIAGPQEEAVRVELGNRAKGDLRAFYAARHWKPLWLGQGAAPGSAVLALLGQVEQAPLEGLRPSRLKARDLRKALDRASSRDPEDLARLELTASRVFAGWVRALITADRAPMIYENSALVPAAPTETAALQQAAAAPSIDAYLATMAWMHPLYAPLRAALLDPGLPDHQRRAVAANLLRLRAIPARPADRYVLVDAAGATLWMYEKGRPVGSMKVVVGKADNQTPMMAGFLRAAILNPYWNVPPDLVGRRIAPNVLDRGIDYLAASGYEVLSDWGEKAQAVDPTLVNWQAIAAGAQPVRVRQKPGGDNFMGRVKFMFPNDQGIYLHDTPDKNLMLKDERQFSSGCVRLEDASRFGRWLLGKSLPRTVKRPEQRVAVPAPVPIYITYLTAFPARSANGTTLAFRADPYGRDGRGGNARRNALAINRPR